MLAGCPNVSWVEISVYLSLELLEKKSEKEVPLWTPQTAGRHGKHRPTPTLTGPLYPQQLDHCQKIKRWYYPASGSSDIPIILLPGVLGITPQGSSKYVSFSRYMPKKKILKGSCFFTVLSSGSCFPWILVLSLSFFGGRSCACSSSFCSYETRRLFSLLPVFLF